MSNVSMFWGIVEAKGHLFGIEMELEQVAEVSSHPLYCRAVDIDNSLRNEGREFISLPITLHQAEDFYKDVMGGKQVSWIDKSKRCSERGSIHVHVNMSDRNIDVVRNLIELYCLLEPGFFEYVDDSRQNNIYCVPLWSTRMLDLVVSSPFNYAPSKWHKYTAFNIKPLESLGTVEFRHLQATESFTTFSNWLHIIQRWMLLDKQAANLSRSEVDDVYFEVFQKHPSPEIKEQLDLCYLQLKASYLNTHPSVIIQRIKEYKTCASA